MCLGVLSICFVIINSFRYKQLPITNRFLSTKYYECVLTNLYRKFKIDS